MSHKATAWAFAMRHLKPATKIVLLQLADCHNPEHGCFPSQSFLADACEMSERSVRDHLTKLEELRLITRVHRENDGTKFQSDMYELHFDRVISEPGKPAAKSAARQKLPEAGNDKSLRQNLPPNPVTETSNFASAREALWTDRPIPHCRVCIPLGSTFEAGWNAFLRSIGEPPMADFAVPVGDGWDAPWKNPPPADDDLKISFVKRWVAWSRTARQRLAA